MTITDAIEVKYSCCSDGARKPVDTVPRKREGVAEVVARRELAGEHLTEVGIGLAADGGVELELLRHLRFKVEVGAAVLAMLLDRVLRPEAAEALGARSRCRTASSPGVI